MFCASASNVVVECIARSTPLIVDRLPSVREYLGPDYPLYLDSVASDLPSFVEQVRDAHLYLRDLDKSWLSYDAFQRDFVKQLSAVAPSAFSAK
jgi:hypothetical protein